jgi:hypothetical protein
MSRPLGGYIGFKPVPTADKAAGVWVLKEYAKATQWPQPIPPPNAFQVSGAGTSQANGKYCASGTYNGKPIYLKQSDDEWELRWVPELFGGGAWVIYDDGNSETMYYVDSEAGTPPLVGWEELDGNPPGPTLSPASCEE